MKFNRIYEGHYRTEDKKYYIKRDYVVGTWQVFDNCGHTIYVNVDNRAPARFGTLKMAKEFVKTKYVI